MISPVIKVKKYDYSINPAVLNATIANLPTQIRLKLEFSNLDFEDLTNRVKFIDNVDESNINEKESLDFSLDILKEEDNFLFVKLVKFENNQWVDLHIASVVLRKEEDKASETESNLIEVSKTYFSNNDKLDFHINASPEKVYDIVIGKRKFGIKTQSDGRAKISIDAATFVEPSWLSSKFVRPINVSLSDRENKDFIYKKKIEFVPESLYALATPDDPLRPSCVIMDPDPVAAFSVATDPLDDFCFPQPLIGNAFNSDGSTFRRLTKLDPSFVNCNDGYVSTAQSVVDAGCKIYGQPRYVRFDEPRKLKNQAVCTSSDSPSLHGLFISSPSDLSRTAWTEHRLGFCYSACDINAEEPGTRVDPCSFSNQEITKIPRIWVGATSDAINLNITTVVRGIIKAPPSYFHSIIIDGGIDGGIENGEAVNVIFDLSSGERISKTLIYNSAIHQNFNGFVSAFGAEISSDSNIVDANIEVDVYPLFNSALTLGRIDVKSNTRFYVYPGQIDSVNPSTGSRLSNNRIKVIKDSKYTLDFEITDPSRVDEIEYAITRGAPTHAVFLSGPFKGLVVSLNKNISNGSISFDTCPRISTARVGLGTFVVESDQPCTYVAFVTNVDAPAASSSIVKPLPFVRNPFNEIIPASNPAMTKDGRVFCQALINGKWQIFGYFPPSLVDYNLVNTSSNYWVQLTDVGENRNVSAASDSFGNVHLVWETDRFGFTSLQYACVGKSQKLINRLAYSGMFSKQISDELYNKIFSFNPMSKVENFIASESTNISLVRSDGVISLVEDALLTGNSYRIIKEFSGYLNIDQNEFDDFIIMNGDAKLPRNTVQWPDSIIPDIDKSTYIESYIIHIDRNGINSTISVNTLLAKFSGKILRVYTSPEDLVKTKKYLSSPNIRYPVSPSAFVNSPVMNFAGLDITDDYHTLSFTEYNYTLNQPFYGPLQMRIIVEGLHGDDSLDQSEWNRVFSNNGKVSVPSSSSVCVSGSPKQDSAIGILSINKDYQGNYISGQESEINFSVHCNCTINPAYKVDASTTGTGVTPISNTALTDAVLERTNNTYTWSGSSQPILIIPEFSGQPGFTQSLQPASSYPNNMVVFEDSTKRYFPGFTEGSNVSSLSISIKTSNTGAPLSSTVVKEVMFTKSKIAALYIESSDLSATDSVLGNAISVRPYFANDQSVKISVNPARQKLTFTFSPGTRIDFSIRVVLEGNEIVNPFSLKTDTQVSDLFNNFVSNFTRENKNLFTFSSNRFTINKTEKRYDTVIPIFGSLKFDDLNTNPKAIASRFENFSQLTSIGSDINTENCSDVSSIGTYELSNAFKVDGEDHNLHHVYVFLVPERVSFIAKNAETIDQYILRTGSINGYREALVEDVYTGMAKVGMVVNGFSSYGVESSISQGIRVKYEDSPTVRIESNMSFQLDLSYLKLSKNDVELLTAWSHPAEDAFFLPTGSEPYYHLMANLYVKEKPKLSLSAQIDLSEKNRQWDFGFGMPFGSNPVARSYNSNYFELLSYAEWELSYSNIRIGVPKISLNNSYSENVNYLYSKSKIFDLVPNLDSNIENDEFEQSIIDPGDWTCLEDGNLLVDEWRGDYGGFIYTGTYANVLSGNRAILLEANVPHENLNSSIYYNLPMLKLRRGRSSTGSGGGISQTLGTFAKDMNTEHVFYMTSGLRPLPEDVPKMTKTLLINVAETCYAIKSKVKNGIYSGDSSPISLQTNVGSFYPTATNFDFQVRNVSDNLCNMFSRYHYTTGFDVANAGAGHIAGTFYKDAIFYVDSTGSLQCEIYSSGQDGSTTEPTVSSSPSGNLFGFGYIAVDSILRFENSEPQNPFGIAITSSGYLKSVSFDGTSSNVPSFAQDANLPADGGYIAVSVGWDHAAALKEDGSISCWGDDTYGQVSGIPVGEKFVQVKCGEYFTIGLKEDGTIAGWGRNYVSNGFIVSSVPSGKYVKIDAGGRHAVAIGFDGIPVSWGYNAGTSDLNDPDIKLIDVAACGGTVYTLATGSSTTLTTYNVEPFNVGIDVDGNVVAWGKYISAFTKISTLIEAQHAVPSVACVAVKRGIRSCSLLGADGRVYSYGVSFAPGRPGNPSNVNTLYKKDKDYFSGGFLINDCKIYPVSNLVEEDANIDAYRLFGLSDESVLDFTFNLYNTKISTVPLCESNYVLQKSPCIHVDKFDKVTVSYEDNVNGPWSVNAISGVYLDRYLQDKIILSQPSYSAFNSNIASDNDGKRMIVWNAVKDNMYAIEYASQTNHPDFTSDCSVDGIISASRTLGVDTDPYDPYELDKSLMSCRVDISFLSPAFANYIFNIEFRDVNNDNIIYKRSSSKIEPGKWLINGKFIPYSGQVLDANERSVISFIPDSNDDVFGKLLKVIITYSTEIIGQEEFIATKVHNITDGADWVTTTASGTYPYVLQGTDAGIDEYVIFEEASLYSPINISRQNEIYFETQGSSAGQNFVFPTNIRSLPGISAGTFCKSFLLSLIDDGNTNAQFVESSVTFSAPIAAVLVDERNLIATDNIFRRQASPVSILRKNVVSSFQFYSGEYIRLSDDRKTLYFRFMIPRNATWPDPIGSQTRPPNNIIQQPNPDLIVDDSSPTLGIEDALDSLTDTVSLVSPVTFPYATLRIIISDSASVSGEIESVFFCAKPIRLPCRINAFYENLNTAVKNVHFKVSVYSDANYEDSVMVFTSLIDSDLWNSGYDEFPVGGIPIASGTTGSVSFNPPIINPGIGQYPLDLGNISQSTGLSNNNVYFNLNRRMFICGAKYFIKVSAIVDGQDIEVYRNSFLCDCDHFANDKELSSSWNSPYSGSVRTELAKSLSRKSHPSVAAGRDGLFMVAWEDSRNGYDKNGISNRNNIFSDIYSAFIDVNSGKIDSSLYQGYDRIVKNTSSAGDLSIIEERYPIVVSDNLNNFSISTIADYNKINKRYLSVGTKISPVIIQESAFVTACSFTLTDIDRYKSAFDGGEFLNIRVSDKYIKDYRYSSNASPIAVVSDCFIDLEVVGVPGAMAYRLRNESEVDFTDWIPIGANIQPLDSLGNSIDNDFAQFRDTFKAKWVGNDIFVAPWVLSKGDGLKRVCIEILTQFGKTQQICLDLVAEYSVISYTVEFMHKINDPSASSATQSADMIKPLKYKGFPVVNNRTPYKNINTDSSNENPIFLVTLTENDLRSTKVETIYAIDVYVKVTFSDIDRIKRLQALNLLKKYSERRNDAGVLSAYVYQQGSSVLSFPLTPLNINEGTYYFQFRVSKNNGVTFKDGLAFVSIYVPSECLNPFSKNFISIIRLINDPILDQSSASLENENNFIESYSMLDKRNSFGSRRIS